MVNVDIYSALMANEQWGFFSVRSEDSLADHAYCDMENPFIMDISEDLWQSHNVIVVCPAGIWAPNLPHSEQTL